VTDGAGACNKAEGKRGAAKLRKAGGLRAQGSERRARKEG